MRIVIDLQGAQSPTSWNRGIGRYATSLVSAMIRNGKQHEFHIVLNGAFPESIERLCDTFDGLLPKNNIRVWNSPLPLAQIDAGNNWRFQASLILLQNFITSLNPDIVLVSSLFEGFYDNSVTWIKNPSFVDYPTAVILYDLIPFVNRKPYLENPAFASWYLDKIEQLRSANLLLAISESSRLEGIEYLGLSPEGCINISSAPDENFKKIQISSDSEKLLRKKYGLKRSFVLYTGGIDHRKNIEGLIRSFGRLQKELRKIHQLAIVCSIQPESKEGLLQLAKEVGLADDEIVLTGYIPEDDLVALYNVCAIFVFPSFYEGFGLPILEAMRCGAPVIGSNTSSIPEVIGLDAALFDPYSDEAICKALERALTDEDFRRLLIAHGEVQVRNFSWDLSAQKAISALEGAARERKSDKSKNAGKTPRKKLAFISPLPPEKSGISDYSALLLPELAQHYDIEVILAQDDVSDTWVRSHCPLRSVDWFKANFTQFDRVVYQFGNSYFHQHMFELLQEFPGVVVLHDFYLSDVLHHMEATRYLPDCFTEQLLHSHQFSGLYDISKGHEISDVISEYPCSRDVIENSIGTIVHSQSSALLAQNWYAHAVESFSVIPLLRAPPANDTRNEARKELGFSERDFIVCTFGMLAPSKLNHRLLVAWINSKLTRECGAHLIFVGENHPSEYGNSLLSSINHHNDKHSIQITNWVDKERYQLYLAAADLGVQLRTHSRGETSAAVLDCMSHGLATIVNANGTMADLANDTVLKMPDHFRDTTLTHALELLWQSTEIRQKIGNKARNCIAEIHAPKKCAIMYRDSIEEFYDKYRPETRQLIDSIKDLNLRPAHEFELIDLAKAIDSNLRSAKL